jgi:hypothetical protein
MNVLLLWVPADSPKTCRDELFVVLFGVSGLPPRGFLGVGDDFEEEGGVEECEGGVVADGERWMGCGGDSVCLFFFT